LDNGTNLVTEKLDLVTKEQDLKKYDLPKALYTLDIFAHNIAIKKKKDIEIKIHFSSNIFFMCVLKIFWGQF